MNLRGAIGLGMGWLAWGGQRRIGLHQDDGTVVAVQSVHRAGGPRIEKTVRLFLGDAPVAERVRLLREGWVREGLAADFIVATFPRRQAIVKNLVLPVAEPREMREMVRLQACRQIPLPEEEIVVGYQLLGPPSEGRLRIEMIVARREDVRRHVEILDGAGFSPQAVILDSPGAPEPAAAASARTARFTDNLLPDEDRRHHLQGRRRAEWITAGALSLVFLSTLIVGLAWHRHVRRQYLDRLVAEEQPLASRAGDLRRMELQTRLIRSQVGKNGSFLHVLAELNRTVPARISIRSLVFEKNQTLEIQGSCFTLPEAVHLVSELQKSPLFSKVELVSSNIRQLQARDIIDFQLACHL